MSDELETVRDAYDVFLVHTEDDNELAYSIDTLLKNQKKKVVSQIEPGAFKAGEPILDNILKYIEKSNTTLLVLTINSYSKPWISLETILAAEKSERDGVLGLRVVWKGLTDQQIKQLQKGILEKVPFMEYETQSDFEKKLASFVSDKLIVGNLLPAGSLAHGQVFSHFTGFLRKVLPGFPAWIRKKAEEKDLPLKNVCGKYFILIPGSCKIQGSLETKKENAEESDITISHVCSLSMVQDHVGKPREFKLSLYSISKEEQTFYFVADYPNVLEAINQLNERELADIDLKYQIARFYFTLNELINHKDNVAFNDTVQIVMINDKTQRLEDVLFQEVETSLRLQQSPDDNPVVSQGQTIPKLPPSTQRLISKAPEREDDAYISCFEDEESQQIANEIEKYLKAKNKTVAREKPNIPWLDQLEYGKWVIFVISENFVTCKMKTFECINALHVGITENNLRIIPIICKGATEKIPGYMKFITYLSITEPNYMENIVQMMNGAPIRMCDKIPCGDVATGLAWAYVLNYLELTLLERDFEQRIRTFLKENKIEERCAVKLFILVPKTCRVPSRVIDEAKNCDDPERTIKFLGDLEPITMHQGAQHKRTYYLHVFMFTNLTTGKKMCLVCEYATPIRCLYEMAHDFPFAGLEKDEMYKQAESFVTKTQDIMNRDAVKKKKGDISTLVDLVYFDDEKENLLDAIEKKLDAGDYPSVPEGDAIEKPE